MIYGNMSFNESCNDTFEDFIFESEMITSVMFIGESGIINEAEGTTSFFEKIKNGFKWVGKQLREIYNKIIGVFKKESQEDRELLKKAKNKNLTIEQIKKLLKIPNYAHYDFSKAPDVKDSNAKLVSFIKNQCNLDISKATADIKGISDNYSFYRDNMDTYGTLGGIEKMASILLSSKVHMTLEEFKQELIGNIRVKAKHFGNTVDKEKIEDHIKIVESLDSDIKIIKEDQKQVEEYINKHIQDVDIIINEIKDLEKSIRKAAKTAEAKGTLTDEMEDEFFSNTDALKIMQSYCQTLCAANKDHISVISCLATTKMSMLRKRYIQSKNIIRRINTLNEDPVKESYSFSIPEIEII